MKKIMFICLMIVSVSGCTSVTRFFNEENPKNVLYINWDEEIAPDFISGKYKEEYLKIRCTKGNEKAKQERNMQLERFLIGVDSYYYKKKNALITGRGFQNAMAEIVQLGLTGVASFAGGGTPNLLAGIATALNGSKISIDKNLFSDQSALLIASKMDQLRLTKINDINTKKTGDCTEYSLDAAMKDGIDYYYTGTINGALLAIFNETGDKMVMEKDRERKFIDKKFSATSLEK